MPSIFADMHDKLYDRRWEGSFVVSDLRGGVPKHPSVALAWIRSSLGDRPEAEIREIYMEHLRNAGLLIEGDDSMSVEEIMEKAKGAQQATAETKLMVGFHRNEDGYLSVEGRNIKAMIKEAANSLWPKRKWGPSNKGTIGYWAEHVYVMPVNLLSLGVKAPTDVDQRFVHTRFGSSIRLEEYIKDAEVKGFIVKTDAPESVIEDKDFKTMWTHAESLGFGANRSLSYGQFEMRQWDKIK